MIDRLQPYCTGAFPGLQDAEVCRLRNISSGWESDVYSFDMEYGPSGKRETRELILQVYPGNDAPVKSEREFRGMEQLYGMGYPVPEVLVLEKDDRPVGGPFMIMERINGEGFWPILTGSTGKRRQKLLTLFCGLLVQLHELDWHPLLADTEEADNEDQYRFIDMILREGREVLRRFSSMPGFIPVIRWLEERRDLVPCDRPSIIHWDFHPGNILLQKDETAVVIDWTQICISDYRFDLAWTLLLISTIEGPEWRVFILEEYERLSGHRVEQIEYFEVAACLKRLLSVVVSLALGPEKLGMRPGAEEMMKQHMGAVRNVYDLLQKQTEISVPEVENMLSEHRCRQESHQHAEGINDAPPR